MVSVVRRLRMRDVHKVLLDRSEVGLDEADLEGNDHVAARTMDGCPATRDGTARLMADPGRELPSSGRNRKTERDGHEQAGDEQHPEDEPTDEQRMGPRPTTRNVAGPIARSSLLISSINARFEVLSGRESAAMGGSVCAFCEGRHARRITYFRTVHQSRALAV